MLCCAYCTEVRLSHWLALTGNGEWKWCVSSVYLTSVYLPVSLSAPTYYLPGYLFIWSYWETSKIARIWRAMPLKRNTMHKDKCYIGHSSPTWNICRHGRLTSLAESFSRMTDKLNTTSGWLPGLENNINICDPSKWKNCEEHSGHFLRLVFFFPPEKLHFRSRSEMEIEKPSQNLEPTFKLVLFLFGLMIFP